MRTVASRVLCWVALVCLLYPPECTFAQSNPLITSLAWSADNAYIAAGTAGGIVTGWNVSTGQIAWNWEGPRQTIQSIFFDTSRHAFLIVEQPAQIILLDEKTGVLDLNLTIDLPERDGRFRSPLTMGAYDDVSGILALVGQIEPSIHLMDLRKVTDSEKAQDIALGAWIYWLHPPAMGEADDTSVVMSIRRPSVSQADVDTLTFPASGTHPADIALCDHANIVLSVSRDGWFAQWDRSTNQPKVSYSRHLEPPFEPHSEVDLPPLPHVSHLACNANIGITTGTTKKYGAIQLWNLSTGVVIDLPKSDPDHHLYDDAYAIDITSDGRFAVTDGEVRFRVWGLTAGKLILEKVIYHLEPGPDYLQGNLAFAKGTHLLAVGDGDFISVVDIDKDTVRCFGVNCRPVTIEHVGRCRTGRCRTDETTPNQPRQRRNWG